LILAFFSTNYTAAHADTLDVPSAKNSLHPGAWAMLFEINYADLAGFDGATIALKYHWSSSSAIRAGLAPTIAISDGAVPGEGEDRQAYGLDMFLDYVHYVHPPSYFSVYFALGPDLSVNWIKSERSSSGYVYTDNYQSWATGVSAGLGVEWFPARRISLSAEYRSSLFYRWSKSERYVTDKSTGQTLDSDVLEGESFNFRGDPVRFGLSLYF
jgi:opacity protein-like surface antigen